MVCKKPSNLELLPPHHLRTIRVFRRQYTACFLRAWLIVLALTATTSAAEVLLFPYFDSNGENGVYLAWSDDGRKFVTVNDGEPIFTPPQWPKQNLTRDPSIVRHDGLYHMVWTSHWNGNILGHATSPDLVTWSEPQQIQPFPAGSEQPKNVWAPEIFVDHVAEDFKIVWSSTLESELNDGDGSKDRHGFDHRMFYIATSDFETFTAPQLLFHDENYSVIDAHVVFDDRQNDQQDDDRWVMSLKKEVSRQRGGKNIRLAFSGREIAPSSFQNTTAPVVGPGSAVRPREQCEGSSLVRWKDQWHLYWDAFGNGHYSLATSEDLETWTDATDQLSLPAKHPRHGSVFVAESSTVGWLSE